MIGYFLNHKLFQKRIYNVKTTSQWLQGNTYGGHKNSGQPPNAIAQFEGPYAFESISCCASIYGIDRRSVRNALNPRARKAQTFIEITSEAFDAWDEDFKITRENADVFDKDYVISQGLSSLAPRDSATQAFGEDTRACAESLGEEASDKRSEQ
ncbi:hypothetical protein EOM81_10955 [bacterium]|nr:hypothetical protein [bacterium]